MEILKYHSWYGVHASVTPLIKAVLLVTNVWVLKMSLQNLRSLWLLSLLIQTLLAASASAALSSTSTTGLSCSSLPTAPIYVAVQNVTLIDGNSKRGVPVSIGSPVQSFAFLVNR